MRFALPQPTMPKLTRPVTEIAAHFCNYAELLQEELGWAGVCGPTTPCYFVRGYGESFPLQTAGGRRACCTTCGWWRP